MLADKARPGIGRLALESGAPIVPVALSGTEGVFPKGRKLPRFPKIRVVVGDPFRLDLHASGVLPRTKLREGTAKAQSRLAAVMHQLEP